MAQNYLQFSLIIEVSKAAQKWLSTELQKRREDAEEPFDADWSFDTKGLWLRAGESANLKCVADLLQAYLKKFSPNESIKFSWAKTCSKLRPDEFSGGAVYITADWVEWSYPWSFFEEMDEKFRKQKAGRHMRMQISCSCGETTMLPHAASCPVTQELVVRETGDE